MGETPISTDGESIPPPRDRSPSPDFKPSRGGAGHFPGGIDSCIHPPWKPKEAQDEVRENVAAVDFSETSRKALKTAFNLAMENQSQLHLLHVVEPYPTDDLSALHPAVEVSGKEARARLESQIPPGVRDWASVEVQVVTGIQPAKSISDFARDLEADLIVIGTHGRKGLPGSCWAAPPRPC